MSPETHNQGKIDNLEEAVQLLEANGYIIKKRPRHYIKKTIDISEDLLRQVDMRRKELNVTLRDVISEALQLWLSKRSHPVRGSKP